MSWVLQRSLIYRRSGTLVPFRVRRGHKPLPSGKNAHWTLLRYGCGWRTVSTTAIYTILTPPAVFAGLFLSLWFYKCCMMVLFQNKIIYMPSIPPFSRSEKIADYARRCSPIVWQEEKLKAADGVNLSLCVASTTGHVPSSAVATHLVVLYFQGNASSLPPRLPYLSDVLKALSIRPPSGETFPVKYTIVALSYRGFWTSRGRPSQRGIEKDAEAALRWVMDTYNSAGGRTRLVLWGQSIGAGVATTAVARYSAQTNLGNPSPWIYGLILETPFTSVRDMLSALYPQQWLPYRHLWPFLWNWWDSREALRVLGRAKGKETLRVLILQAGKDELVPKQHGMELEDICRRNGVEVERKEVAGALHTDVIAKGQGRSAIVSFLSDICKT